MGGVSQRRVEGGEPGKAGGKALGAQSLQANLATVPHDGPHMTYPTDLELQGSRG